MKRGVRARGPADDGDRAAMFNRLSSAALLVCAGLMSTLGAASALAVCAAPATQLTGSSSPTLANRLGNNTVCVGPAGNRTNQEFHNGTTAGTIIDYKKGPSDAKDPTETIGTFTIVGGNSVTYTYNAGGTFSFTVWQQANGSLDFCNGTTALVSGATVLTGQVACN